MRLLDVNRLEFREFGGSASCPKYAILSHRWGDEEITLQSFGEARKEVEQAMEQHSEQRQHSNAGSSKIAGACLQARQHGLDYLWVDTCCIDKTSTVEMAESLNSMFKCYERAQACYSHLMDVVSLADDPQFAAHFRNSQWFTRGWTLQELLAPQNLQFFNCDWVLLGSKQELSADVQAVTLIPSQYLYHQEPLRKASVAQRMSWASKRRTTRIEDRAYSLFGIFDVSIEMRYGEEERAFQRLQQAIIQSCPDETIFAWTCRGLKDSGILAPRPDCFKPCANISSSCGMPGRNTTGKTYQITNQGLEFPSPSREALRKVAQSTGPDSLLTWRKVGQDGYWLEMNESLEKIWSLFRVKFREERSDTLANQRRNELDRQRNNQVNEVSIGRYIRSPNRDPPTIILGLNAWNMGDRVRPRAIMLKLYMSEPGRWRRLDCHKLDLGTLFESSRVLAERQRSRIYIDL